MRHRRRIAAIGFVVIGIVATTTAVAARSNGSDPKSAAAALVKSLRPDGATKIAYRNGGLWLGLGSSSPPNRERFRIYRWDAHAWSLVGDVRWRGFGNSPWPIAVSLTGSKDPDFAAQGCGAGDMNCLSIVSDIGGRWHVVPFEYGLGRALVVNGLPKGSVVSTEFDACGCAGGPTTWMYERYSGGMFRPGAGPRPTPRCSRVDLEATAGVGAVATLQFDRVACAGGWALAAGTGAGYDGPVVGLFNRSAIHPSRWRLITLDNGLSLPTASGIYDLPPALLIALERKLGPSFNPIADATRLVDRLRHSGRRLRSSGLVRVGNTLWLAAIDDPRHAAFSAEIYRWEGSRWVVAGRIAHDRRLQSFTSGWFVSIPTSDGVALGYANSSGPNPAPAPLGKFAITNAGGRWHVAPRPR